jgi:hypothetical protein
MDGVLAVVRLAIDRLHGPRKDVAELLYGLAADSAGRKIKERRELARAKYCEITGREYAYETFRTNAEKTLITDLAKTLIVLIEECDSIATLPRSDSPTPTVGPTEPKPPGSEIAPHPRGGPFVRSMTRRRATLGLVIGVAVVWVLAFILHFDTAPRVSHLPSLARLEDEAERQLVGVQAPSPDSHPTNKLGWGDPTSHGRHIYYPGDPAPTTPTFDSIYDSDEDERQFLGVSVSTATTTNLENLTEQRAVIAHPSMVVWVFVKAVNGAARTTGCELVGPSIAENTQLKLSIWNSPSRNLHIIRAWITAQNTKPRWVTDAVAVVTTSADTLVPDGQLSKEYSQVTPYFEKGQTFSVGTLAASGIEIGSVGSCPQDAYYFNIALRQRK